MLEIKLPDETFVERVLEVGQIHTINKIAGKYITAWFHYTFSYFDTFEVLEISRHSVTVKFKKDKQEQVSIITKLYFAKYFENCLTNSN